MAAAKKNRSTPKKTRPGAKKRPSARAPAAPKRAAPRALPNDDAWRELIETALEKTDPAGGASKAKPPAKKKAARK